MLEATMWVVTVCLMLIGVAGVIVPILPGTTLILGAAILHKVVLPEGISWAAIAWIAAFWALSVIADFGGVLLGTRWFGGSKWGMAGASGGALVGMFFSLPALVLGTICGAMAAEKWIAKKSGKESLRAGAGAAVGFVISTVVRLACGVVMIALFLVAALSGAAVG